MTIEAKTQETKVMGETVREQYGKTMHWQHAGVTHACEGSQMIPFDRGTFLLWTVCGKHDVPAGKSHYSHGNDAVTCPGCLESLKVQKP